MASPKVYAIDTFVAHKRAAQRKVALKSNQTLWTHARVHNKFEKFDITSHTPSSLCVVVHPRTHKSQARTVHSPISKAPFSDEILRRAFLTHETNWVFFCRCCWFLRTYTPAANPLKHHAEKPRTKPANNRNHTPSTPQSASNRTTNTQNPVLSLLGCMSQNKGFSCSRFLFAARASCPAHTNS